MSSTNPFAAVASATVGGGVGRRALVVAPAMFAVGVAALSVLVSERAHLALALSLAWLSTVVVNPNPKLYAQLLDRWWAFSLLLVVTLSMYPQTNDPLIITKLSVAADHSAVDSLAVNIKEIHGAPWGCTHRELGVWAVFRSHRTSVQSGKFGEWAQVDVAQIPHEEYLQLPPMSNASVATSTPAKFALRNIADRDLVIKVGIKCLHFPADWLFGRELYLLDSESSELHKFQSPTPIRPPKPPLIPRIVLNILNPFQWPFLILNTLRTYTTIIELGIVWPLLTRVLKRVLVNYRQDRISEGKEVVDLEALDNKVHSRVVLLGVGELFTALGALFLGHGLGKKKSRKPDTLDHDHISLETHHVDAAAADAAATAAAIRKSASPTRMATKTSLNLHQKQSQHTRATSSPVRSSTTTFADAYYTASLHKPIVKLVKAQSLWDDSSTPSRFVGQLVSGIAGGLGASTRRRRRWEIPGYVFVVIKGYEPAFKDELSISIGNIVRIKKIFDDGWALGVNQSTNMQGILPMAFLTCINPTSPSAPPIDPQQFIPRSPSATAVPAVTTHHHQNPVAEEVDDTLLSFTGTQPPQHLRKRGRSVTSSVRTRTTPTLSAQELGQTTTAHSYTEKPRGRSSSMHRSASSRRGEATTTTNKGQQQPTVGRTTSTVSLKPAPGVPTPGTPPSQATSVTAPVGPPSMTRARMNSNASSVKRGRPGAPSANTNSVAPPAATAAAVQSVPESDDDFASAYGEHEDENTLRNGGNGYYDGEEEVVVVEGGYDDDEATSSNGGVGGAGGGSDEDRDVWPPVRGGGAGGVGGVDRKASLGGYSKA